MELPQTDVIQILGRNQSVGFLFVYAYGAMSLRARDWGW